MIYTCGTLVHDTKKFLICHVTNSNPSRWDIPKGIKEDNESYLECASRELYEETNINRHIYDSSINFLGIHSYTRGKFLVLYELKFWNPNNSSNWLLSTSSLKCNSLIDNSNSPEVDNFMYVTMEEAKDYVTPNLYSIISRFPLSYLN